MNIINTIKARCNSQCYLFAWFITVLITANLFLFCTESYSLWAKICTVLLPLGCYWMCFSWVRKPGKMIWILLPFLFLGAFQLVLLYLFKESIIAVDMFLNLATTNSGEALELLDKLYPAVVGVLIWYGGALVLGVVSVYSKIKLSNSFLRKNRFIAGGIIATGGISLILAYHTDPAYAITKQLYPVNVFYNIGLAIERNTQSNNYVYTSHDFTFEAQSSHPNEDKEVYIFVIGETARAKNWGIYGYERNTTPLLSLTSGLVVFQDALTQSNATHKSVPILLSTASAENYDCIYNQKGIITAFKEAGFYTAFYSNQKPNGSFIDFLGAEADESVFIKSNANSSSVVHSYDEQLISHVRQLLQNKQHHKLFIVLHSYGSHFDYQERYPDSLAVFIPDKVLDVNASCRQELINAYDNSIAYTDLFLSSLISLVDDSVTQSALVYISDHGEDIFDDSRNRFLHASPLPTYYQLHVPFLIWNSAAYRNQYPQIYQNAQQNSCQPISSNVVFHTLLSLGGIHSPYLQENLSVVSPRFFVKERFFLNDHNDPVSILQSGIKKADIEQFKKMNLYLPNPE